MAGLLAAALGGAGEAVQTNAKLELKKRKEAALMGLRQKYAMEQQNDQQQFTATENDKGRTFQRGERIAGQDFTAAENTADRNLRSNLAAQQEAGANSRSAAGGWTVVPNQDGGYSRFNTVTGETGDVPEGINPSGGGEITKRQELMFKQLGGQIEQIDKQLNDSNAMLDEATRAQLKVKRNQLAGEQRQIIGMGEQSSGGDLATRLADTLGAPEEGARQGGQPQDFNTAVQRTQQNRQATEQQQQTEKQQTQIESQIDDVAGQVQSIFGSRPNGLLGQSSKSLGMSSADKQQQGRALLKQMRTLYNDPNTSEFQRRRIAEQLDALAKAGISIEDF
ncbi:hypothetical protein [Halomonas sp. IOP_31]|uniref:hypothetical protein n=1 Tax=Halomonas sp. IOP_31 TaxID=2876584 RepID=UPI001E340471|nr:hypothetical protein [Halomonas sp. IOP_31]MCD6006918.1 hypothetical protein [Halomonas sp. IOP_31]